MRAADVGPRHAARVLPARRLTLALAAIAVSLPLLTAGLAVAGVKLPGFASSAFEQVGLELPNQAAAGAADSGQGAGALANDGAGSPADGARGEVGDERRKGARGGEASRFGRCVSRASRAGAAHPGRRCAHLKKGKAKGKAKAIGKGQAKGKGQAPGSSGGKPGKGPAKEAKAPKDKPKKAKPDSPGKSGSAPGKAKPDDKDKGKHGTKGPGKGTGGAKKK